MRAVQGYYCLQIIVTIVRGSGYMGETKIPARDMGTVREVCFYKLDTPPTVRVKFNTCGPKCECMGSHQRGHKGCAPSGILYSRRTLVALQ